MVVVGGDSGCCDVIVIFYRPLYVLRFLLSTGMLSALKMVTSFFVKSADQVESHICPIGRRLALFRFGYAWACVDADGNFRRGKCPKGVSLII